MAENKCISCKRRIEVLPGSTMFPCPKCGEDIIVRCGHCREIAAPYKCPKCGFEGPN